MASFKNVSDAPRWVPALGRDVAPGDVIDDVDNTRLEWSQPAIWQQVEDKATKKKPAAHK